MGECWLQQHMAKEGYFSPYVRLVEGVHRQQHAAAAAVWGRGKTDRHSAIIVHNIKPEIKTKTLI